MYALGKVTGVRAEVKDRPSLFESTTGGNGMDGTATVERHEKGDLSDLELSPEEAATEAAEAAAARERELGAADEAVQTAYQRTYDATLAQAALDAEDAAAGDGKADELRGEAGEPVGEMPAGEPESTVVPPDKLIVSGTAQGSRRKWNGKAPGKVILNVKAMKIEVPDGEFKKGERILFAGEALVVSEGVKDKLDKDTKAPVEAVQEHAAVVLDFELRDE
jgi:hypothetical protein